MKKMLGLLLALFLTITALAVPASAVYSGNCGTWSSTANWTLDDFDGVLTISGTGEMKDYSYSSSAPWYSYSGSITRVVISEGITKIGNYAFYKCSNLTSVTIPESVTSIGVNAFDGCSSLTSVTIPRGVTSIEDNTFDGCSSLTCVIISGSVRSIGVAAFTECSSLTNISIPVSVSTIGECAFSNCSSLTSVVIPKSVYSIPQLAFWNCKNLKTVTIPESIAKMWYDAFADCPNLSTVYYGGSMEQWNKLIADTGNNQLRDATVYPQKFKIVFDAGDGNVSPTSKLITREDTSYGELPTPGRTYYIFDGWYTAPIGGDLIESTTAFTAGKDQTLYAHWIGEPHTLFFDANGGTVEPDQKTVRYHSSCGELPTPTRIHYTFDGWYTDATNGFLIDSTKIFTSLTDKTLYAHWSLKNYTVRFNPNGGSVSTFSKQITYGSSYGTLPTPTRSHYTFDGWYTTEDGGNRVKSTTTFIADYDHTLYAHWTPNSYTVHFDPMGGIGYIADRTVVYGSAYGELPMPTRTHYIFDGWYTASKGGALIESTTAFTAGEEQTLYAHWLGEPYTVFFDANGGTVELSQKTIRYNSYYSELPTPTRIHYTFDGWYTAAANGTQINSTTAFTSSTDQTLYAHWLPQKYTVRFNPNGGSVSTASQQIAYGESYGTLPTPTRSNYTFDGWFTAVEGGTIITSTTIVELTGEQTLYAHWIYSPSSYDVFFNPMGGTVDTESKTVTNDSAYGELPAPTRSGYDFGGWYTEESRGTKITSATIVNLTDNQTLYAHWVAKTYTVTWMDADGTVYETDYDVPAGTMPAYHGAQPVKTGAAFAGWSPSIAPVTGNVTYMAVFAYAGGGGGEIGAKIVGGNVTGRPGTTVDLPVAIRSNPGVTSLRFTVSYDSNVLTLTEIVDSGVLAGKTHSSNLSKNPYTLDWNDDTAEENNTEDGVIATLRFTVAEDAPEGSVPVSIAFSESLNAGMDYVTFAVESGCVTVTHTIPGDVNGDGIVDGRDRMTLARYLADWDGYSIDELAADVNEDGTVNGKDRMILARHLADWDGYETLPYHPN